MKYKNINIKIYNKQLFFYFSFRYLEVSKYNYIGDKKFKSIMIEKKFEHHCNLKFVSNNADGSTLYNYLTCNTKLPNHESENIGSWYDSFNILKTQYINYNYQTITTTKTDLLFQKSNSMNFLNMSKHIEKMLKDSNKTEIIEFNINKGLEYFDNCIKKTNNFVGCKQNLLITYDNNAELILNLWFFK